MRKLTKFNKISTDIKVVRTDISQIKRDLLTTRQEVLNSRQDIMNLTGDINAKFDIIVDLLTNLDQVYDVKKLIIEE